MIDYSTLNVRIEALGGDRYRVIVRGTDGDGQCEFGLGFESTDLDTLAAAVSRPRSARRRIESDESAYARTFGARLFQLAFQDTARDVLRASLGRARHENKGVRFLLELDGARQLRNVPWELLWDSPRFISTSAYTPVLRYVDIAARPLPLALQPPLRILGLVSSPGDMPALDAGREKEQLADACRSLTERGLLTIDWVADATLSGLLERLEDRDYHIFHFIGHGDFDEEHQDGVLLFEARAGRSQRVTGVELATILADQRSLRLAVINACEGARMALDSNGVAANLMQYGLPAVIAMQFEISDEAAIVFARQFYGSIARSHPIDEALADARRGMFAAGHGLEWATPVLFTNLDDGRLFDIDLAALEQLAPVAPTPEPAESAFDAELEPAETTAEPLTPSQPPHVGLPDAATDSNEKRALLPRLGVPARLKHALRPSALLFAGAAAAVLVLVVAVLVLTGALSGSSRWHAGAPISVGQSPVGVAVGQEWVWVAGSDFGTISRIWQGTPHQVVTGKVGGEPNSIAVPQNGPVWVANIERRQQRGHVIRIDPFTLKEVGNEIGVGGKPNTLTIHATVVWVANSAENTVSRISTVSDEVLTPEIHVGQHPSGIATSNDAVWVANQGDQTITRINLSSPFETEKINVYASTQGIAFARGALWVTNPKEGTVRRIDPVKKKVVDKIKVGLKPEGIAANRSGIWVANSGDETVSHFEPGRAEHRVETIRLGGKPLAIAAGEGPVSVWVTYRQHNNPEEPKAIPITR
jgi:DNA-binding beta-propeller fold protein YncE